MPWPKAVPYLYPENIAKNAFSIRDNQDCNDVSRWLHRLFVMHTPEWYKAVHKLCLLLQDEETFRDPQSVGVMSALILWNDSNHVTTEEIADTLNHLFRLLGYTEYEYVDLPYLLS